MIAIHEGEADVPREQKKKNISLRHLKAIKFETSLNMVFVINQRTISAVKVSL